MTFRPNPTPQRLGDAEEDQREAGNVERILYANIRVVRHAIWTITNVLENDHTRDDEREGKEPDPEKGADFLSGFWRQLHHPSEHGIEDERGGELHRSVHQGEPNYGNLERV